MTTLTSNPTSSQCGGFKISIIGEEDSHHTVYRDQYNRYILELNKNEDKKKFGISLINNKARRCRVKLHYQGVHIGTWILQAWQSASLFHPVKDLHAFEASRVESKQGQKLGFQKDDENNGKIGVDVVWKKPIQYVPRSSTTNFTAPVLRGGLPLPTTHHIESGRRAHRSTTFRCATSTPASPPPTATYRSAKVTEAGLGFSADKTKQGHYEDATGFAIDESSRQKFSLRLLLKTCEVPAAKSVAEYQKERQQHEAPSLSNLGWNS